MEDGAAYTRRASSQSPSAPIERARHTQRSLVEHLGVDHGGVQTRMPQEFLERPEVVAVERVRRDCRLWQLARLVSPAAPTAVVTAFWTTDS